MQEILLSFPSWDWKKFDSKHFFKVSFELTEVYRESIFANLFGNWYQGLSNVESKLDIYIIVCIKFSS